MAQTNIVINYHGVPTVLIREGAFLPSLDISVSSPLEFPMHALCGHAGDRVTTIAWALHGRRSSRRSSSSVLSHFRQLTSLPPSSFLRAPVQRLLFSSVTCISPSPLLLCGITEAECTDNLPDNELEEAGSTSALSQALAPTLRGRMMINHIRFSLQSPRAVCSKAEGFVVSQSVLG